MAAQKEIHVLNWPEKELIKLPTALEDEIIACFRAEQELMAQKHLAQNLRNLLNKSDQSQRALEMQLNITGGSVNVSLGEELGFPEHNLTPLSFEEEFNAPKPNPSPYPKLHPPVKKEQAEAALPEHDITDVTSLHSLEEGCDSEDPAQFSPHQKPCSLVKTEFAYQETGPMMISNPATELVKLQGNISNHPPKNETETILKILLMRGNKDFSKGSTCQRALVF